MYKEPKAMREIHQIRERLYEEEKHLSAEEKIAKIHREAEKAIKKYGLKFRKSGDTSLNSSNQKNMDSNHLPPS